MLRSLTMRRVQYVQMLTRLRGMGVDVADLQRLAAPFERGEQSAFEIEAETEDGLRAFDLQVLTDHKERRVTGLLSEINRDLTAPLAPDLWHPRRQVAAQTEQEVLTWALTLVMRVLDGRPGDNVPDDV